jgi:cell division protein FtsI (penicillin-binding protein 3)
MGVNRGKVLSAAMLFGWTGLLVCLGYTQLFRWTHYEQEARRQHWTRLELLAQRGRVFDRQGRPLTLDRSCCSVRILPQYARNRDTLADILAGFNLGPRSAIARQLEMRRRLFWFARHIDYGVGDSLRRVLAGRQFSNCTLVDDDMRRVYPYGEACAGVVGFIGEDRGLAGIETEYDSILRGAPGWMLLQRDAIGRSYPYPSYPIRQPLAGADIRLTLDVDVQNICYEALRDQVGQTGALKGSAVVLDARTGAILGMADFPSYDPNSFHEFSKDRYKCTAIADQFEPGSSFKLVICAAALESPNAARLTSQTYDVSAGFIQVGKYRIHDVHNNGLLDFDGLFVKSSNPGCALLSMQVEPELYYQIARGLGFGDAVGIGLPGEGSGGIDKPNRLTTLRFANVAFGQGVTVTLLQLAAAYLCVANDGEYLRPYLIESVRQGDRVLRRSVPTVVRRVLKPATAGRMKGILERVITEGTGTLARIDGIPACGKTGTAQKTEPGGGYSRTRSRMTFVGFFPKESPEYAVAVLIDEPQTVRFAGSTSCPAFKEIGDRLVLLDRMRNREAADTLPLVENGTRHRRGA